MEMEEYGSNSHKSREERSRGTPDGEVKKVVTGEVTTRKKSGIQKFAESLICGGAESVRDYIVEDIIIPKVKDVISDIAGALCDNLKDGINALLYGKDGKKSKPSANVETVSYRQRYSANSQELIFKTRGEAEDVLSEMKRMLGKYGLISVASMYEMADILPNATDYNYGWKDLSAASVERVREGWLIKLPKAMPLD